jgi:hypothetical protein
MPPRNPNNNNNEDEDADATIAPPRLMMR